MDRPHIAFFPDSFHEVNGVAHTSRQFEAWARREGMPFLCVRAAQPGVRGRAVLAKDGPVWTLDLPRSRLAVPLEQDLWFDPLFARHGRAIAEALRAFEPSVIHITGPSELGIAGAIAAWKMHQPLAASWHTNVHEYAARRIGWLTRRVGRTGPRLAGRLERLVENGALAATARFYRLAKVLYAPNPALCALLQRQTGRSCHLMTRGVDTELFQPARRTRAEAGVPAQSQAQDAMQEPAVLGYVGRLSVEKNVELLPQVNTELRSRGVPVRWLIVGHGAEQARLQREFGEAAEFAGVLRGEALAEAYANMDLLVFPSHTDTFGNVVLETLASGVPAVVTPDGGPAHIVQDGVTGTVATDAGFAAAIEGLLKDAGRFATMRNEARQYALGCSWDAVFRGVVAAYPRREARA